MNKSKTNVVQHRPTNTLKYFLPSMFTVAFILTWQLTSHDLVLIFLFFWIHLLWFMHGCKASTFLQHGVVLYTIMTYIHMPTLQNCLCCPKSTMLASFGTTHRPITDSITYHLVILPFYILTCLLNFSDEFKINDKNLYETVLCMKKDIT